MRGEKKKKNKWEKKNTRNRIQYRKHFKITFCVCSRRMISFSVLSDMSPESGVPEGLLNLSAVLGWRVGGRA